MRPLAYLFILLFILGALSGCAGRLQCEWLTKEENQLRTIEAIQEKLDARKEINDQKEQ